MEMANQLEFVAALLGVLSVVFVIRRSTLAFPIGIAMAALYAFIFYRQPYYAQMGLQLFFIGMQAWGWYEWYTGEQDEQQRVKVRYTFSVKQWIAAATAAGLGILILGWLLKTSSDGQLPYLDATTASLSVLGQFLMNRRQIQHWLVWMVADALLIVQMALGALYWSAALYAILFIQAMVGYFYWKNSSKA